MDTDVYETVCGRLDRRVHSAVRSVEHSASVHMHSGKPRSKHDLVVNY